MKYKEITVYAEDSRQLSELTERLTAEGMEELMINDPSDVDELIEGSWAYTGSVADRELLDSFREKVFSPVSSVEISSMGTVISSMEPAKASVPCFAA